MLEKITSFRDGYFFLSNFYPSTLIYGDIVYQNVEAAFQAQKVLEHEERRRFSGLSPSDAKALGRKVALRSDWESVKDEIMLEICRAKFRQKPDLAKLLCDTGDTELVEGNVWGDTYWGVCKGKGMNMLGKILMTVRGELKSGQS